MAEKLLDQETIRRLEQLSLVSRKISTGKMRGERRSRRRGSSTDFSDYRNYVAGDDMRFLDWKVYGRLERLFIKLFLEEEDLRVHILIDTSPSMQYGSPEKLLYAKRVAAAIGHICMSRMDSLTATGFGDGLTESFGPKRGKVNSRAYFEFLSNLKLSDHTSLETSMRSMASMSRTKGLVVVLSDFYDFEGYENALRQVFARDFELLAIHVLSPDELEPPYQGDIRLVDCEFDSSTDVSMGNSVLKVYRKTMTTFCNGLKHHVISRGGYYVLTSTDNPFDRLVFDVLRRKGLIR